MITEEPFTSSAGKTISFSNGTGVAAWRGKMDKDGVDAIAVQMGDIEFCMLIKYAVALASLLGQLVTKEEVQAVIGELQINKIKR